LAGSDKIYSVDISFLTSKKRLQITLEKFIESHHNGQLKTYIHYLPERFKTLTDIMTNYDQRSLDDILQKLNITYLIEDARKLSLPENSVDLVNSNNTFEHIYPSILIPILSEFKRVVNKKEGVMSHFVDMSDHFAHFDKSINIYNFLQFSDRQWEYIDNAIQPQNRNRMCDYKKIFADLSIPINASSYREGNLNELKTISLANKYLDYPLEEIAISHCHLISVMKNTPDEIISQN
jgi:hypothetical protein